MMDNGNEGRVSRTGAYALYMIAAAGNILLPYIMPTVGIFAAAPVYYALFMLLPCVVYVKRKGALDRVWPEPPKLSRIPLIAAAALVGVAFSAYITYLWTQFLSLLGYGLTETAYENAETAVQLVGMIVLSAILPGICEEFLFRGVMLSGLESKMPERRAVFVCALLFACLHGSPEGFAAELITGCVLGYIVTATGSIYSAVIYHTLHNSFVLMINYMSRGAEAAETAFDPVGDIGTALIYGAIYFIIVRLICRGHRSEQIERERMTGAELAVCISAYVSAAVFMVSAFFD